MEGIEKELTEKLSLVKTECNVRAQDIESMRSQLNDYSNQLEVAQRRDTVSHEWTIYGIFIGAACAVAGLAYYYGWNAVAVGIVCGAVSCLLSDRKNKTE